MTFDVHTAVKDAEHHNLRLVVNEVCDPVMTVGRFANFTVCNRLIPLAQSRVLAEDLRTFRTNAFDHACGRTRVVVDDVLVDFLQTA